MAKGAGSWLSKLQKLEGAVNLEGDPFENVISMPTPSMRYVFGKGGGLPRGFSATFWGPPGQGKSLATYALTGHVHKTDPEAIVIKLNTELRESVQLPKIQYPMWGIDPDRYQPYDINTPEGVFDKIEKEIGAMCEEGAPIRLIIIDSLNNIQGRRAMNADSIMVQNRGDEAMTLQEGFKRIIPVIRKYKIGLVCTNQARAEQDPIEQMRGHKIRMASAFAIQHYIEYWVYFEKNKTVEGRTDAAGNKFINEDRTDLAGKEEKTGFKVRFRMEKSSLGVDGRAGEFTFDFNKGIINTHEEVFELGVGLGIIKKPNNIMYEYEGNEWRGRETMLNAVRDNQELQESLLKKILEIDK